jgi:hypothetical protein
VRLIANIGAHFDPIEDVTLADARQLVDFIRELTKFSTFFRSSSMSGEQHRHSKPLNAPLRQHWVEGWTR